MLIELDKEDFVSLIKGCYVSYDHMFDPDVKELGTYIGGFHDRWEWDETSLNKLSEEELYNVYKKLK